MTWFDTKNGQRLLNAEEAILSDFLEDKFGYFSLQTHTLGRNLLKQTRMNHHIMMEGPDRNIVCSSMHLPFEKDSIDLIISQHQLEKIGNIQALFSEFFRVIIPGGRVVILSFNPFSFAGLRNLTCFDNFSPWNQKFISLSAAQKILKEEGFTVEEGRMVDYQPLFSDNASDHKLFEDVGARWLPLFGNVYFIVARKDVVGVTPLRPKWNKMKHDKAVPNKLKAIDD
ncbi:methyltransferase domain-containing protein [Methylophilaceae bacterium]|nr:methyltransferase domain-containing protein [Betaproteobacteria bacterium]MCH9842541.1 methyltransferase domain-containing protein [Betaproteobacteria bacterium]MDA9085597.1 methyltransferase domain-containing protein [Methylophilaceae bacterium]MDA9088010.1 methyltransferase domain-containing protein [Methylophilaceae bacterium]MDC1281520.1 methyltransferase domain-containing protein [Methylophilaceae bacterium]